MLTERLGFSWLVHVSRIHLHQPWCRLSVGLTGLAAGFSIGVVGDAGVGYCTTTAAIRRNGRFFCTRHFLFALTCHVGVDSDLRRSFGALRCCVPSVVRFFMPINISRPYRGPYHAHKDGAKSLE